MGVAEIAIFRGKFGDKDLNSTALLRYGLLKVVPLLLQKFGRVFCSAMVYLDHKNVNIIISGSS